MDCPLLDSCYGRQTKDNYIKTCCGKYDECILYKIKVSHPEKQPKEWKKEIKD